MKKIIIGITIVILLILNTALVLAENKTWEFGASKVTKIQDGNINCYVAEGKYTLEALSISCVKVK